jgi:ribosome-interacting GTPase 1
MPTAREESWACLFHIPFLSVKDESLVALKEAVWKLTGLIRVSLRHHKQMDEEPLALEPGATILDVATEVHSE